MSLKICNEIITYNSQVENALAAFQAPSISTLDGYR